MPLKGTDKLELDKLLELAKELSQQGKLGISRSDYIFLMVETLCHLHPEVYQLPQVQEFAEKLRKYNEEDTR